MRKVLSSVVVVLFLSSLVSAADKERERIEAALVRIEKSDLKFIRNGEEHSGKDAAQHLRDKLKMAGDKVKTFDEFIERVASKSSLTGKPYLVKLSDGKTIEMEKWLRE